MSKARCASTADDTVPVRITVSSTACTRISSSGSTVFRMPSSAPMSRSVTLIDRMAIWRPSLSMAKIVVGPLASAMT